MPQTLDYRPPQPPKSQNWWPFWLILVTCGAGLGLFGLIRGVRQTPDMPAGIEYLVAMLVCWFIAMPAACVFAIWRGISRQRHLRQLEGSQCGACGSSVLPEFGSNCPQCGALFKDAGIESQKLPRPLFPWGILAVWVSVFPGVAFLAIWGTLRLIPSQVSTVQDSDFRLTADVSGEHVFILAASRGYGPFLNNQYVEIYSGIRPPPGGPESLAGSIMRVQLIWADDGEPTITITPDMFPAGTPRPSPLLVTHIPPKTEDIKRIMLQCSFPDDPKLNSRVADAISDLLRNVILDRRTIPKRAGVYIRAQNSRHTGIEPTANCLGAISLIEIVGGLAGSILLTRRWHRLRLQRWRIASTSQS